MLRPLRLNIYLWAHANQNQILKKNLQPRLLVSHQTSISHPGYCTYKAHSKENTASRLHLRWISTDAVTSHLLETEELRELSFCYKSQLRYITILSYDELIGIKFNVVFLKVCGDGWFITLHLCLPLPVVWGTFDIHNVSRSVSTLSNCHSIDIKIYFTLKING
jgi:hypothetical protein